MGDYGRSGLFPHGNSGNSTLFRSFPLFSTVFRYFRCFPLFLKVGPLLSLNCQKERASSRRKPAADGSRLA